MMPKGDYNLLVNNGECKMTVLEFKKNNPIAYDELTKNMFYKKNIIKLRNYSNIHRFESESFITTKFTDSYVYYYFDNKKEDNKEVQEYSLFCPIDTYESLCFFDEPSEAFRSRSYLK